MLTTRQIDFQNTKVLRFSSKHHHTTKKINFIINWVLTCTAVVFAIETAIEVENSRDENGMPVIPYVKKHNLFGACISGNA